jgi:(p)ppGpp synthase/HD superfamily hydrolase
MALQLFSTKFDQALDFCKFHHSKINQRRKYTNDPYWYHPVEVMELVWSVGGSENMMCAALLHDVVEDTGVKLVEIESKFGKVVAEFVDDLTDVSKPSDGNRRASRKKIDREHTFKASPDAKTIKLADLISNTKSIVQFDKNFAKVYMKEKLALMDGLVEGNQALFKEASKILNEYFK